MLCEGYIFIDFWFVTAFWPFITSRCDVHEQYRSSIISFYGCVFISHATECLILFHIFTLKCTCLFNKKKACFFTWKCFFLFYFFGVNMFCCVVVFINWCLIFVVWWFFFFFFFVGERGVWNIFFLDLKRWPPKKINGGF